MQTPENKEIPKKYTFSGHETFQCRHQWLKKGYDFVKAGKSFNSEDAVLDLGVGKNMVISIKYWMKAFDLLDDNNHPTPLADRLFKDRAGWDKYLEDEATMWLLHYHLVKKGFASTYWMIFNEFRKEKIEFTKTNFETYIDRKSKEHGFRYHPKTLNDDFDIFLKMYMKSDVQSKDKEESFSGLLTELGIVKSKGMGNERYYVIENTERDQIPEEVILYCILDSMDFDLSINLSSIEQSYNSIGSVFAMNRAGIHNKIEAIVEKYKKDISYSDHAGVRELQFKNKPDALTILADYYGN